MISYSLAHTVVALFYWSCPRLCKTIRLMGRLLIRTKPLIRAVLRLYWHRAIRIIENPLYLLINDHTYYVKSSSSSVIGVSNYPLWWGHLINEHIQATFLLCPNYRIPLCYPWCALVQFILGPCTCKFDLLWMKVWIQSGKQLIYMYPTTRN